MLAEGSESTRSLLAKTLLAHGYEVYSCDSGERLLEDFALVNPDIVLIDAEMSGMDGVDVCMELRRRPASYNVLIALISGKEEEADIVRGLTCGADEYILKPVRKNELLAKLSLMLSKRGSWLGPDMAPNVIFASHYKVEKLLGRGGFSSVYLAQDTRNETQVALKILERRTQERKYISQFLREAYGLSLLNHKNIVRLVEFGSYAGKHFIATEFVEGQSLGSLIANSPVSENYALFIASEILDALEYMNMFGIVHRDVKPDNILISPEGRIVLVDFGLAKDESQHTLSLEGEMQGTPEYLAPEYIRNDKSQTIKIDIYSLGITLFDAVAGDPPFTGDPRAVISAHLSKTPPKLSERMPFISSAFSNMVDRMLIKDSRRRCGLKELSELIENAYAAISNKPSGVETMAAKQEDLAKMSTQPNHHHKSPVEEASLKYHREPTPGKIRVLPSKPCETQQDLSLAYTPGVATPCLAIKESPETVWDFTSRGNTVAVVSDGTAVLGLGNIGPEAGMPVMEGKAVLFKKFADIDAIPLCLGSVAGADKRSDAAKIIETVKRLEPSFGGINLEDIGAPACFKVETELKKSMAIPVFHDDQHGTAIISLAGILNALLLTGRKIEEARFVVNGAGAAGIACSEYYISAGAKRENFLLCDSKGVIHKGRTDLNPEKAAFAAETSARTLADAMKGADVFVGVSVGGAVSEEMVRSMAKDPIVFAMANPTPEIFPDKALAAGAAIACTGRSDFPNQVNNVLGFPGIFRGALDVRASDINHAMMMAASTALAEIVREKIPDDIYDLLSCAYPNDAKAGLFDGNEPLKSSFVIPKPFDPRVVPRVAARVAKAAVESGVAKLTPDDFAEYEKSVALRVRESTL
jgi:malate dehydrogenase (oxaloacetate-decarboxylating)(NADP+)